jgi:hypothetical protein
MERITKEVVNKYIHNLKVLQNGELRDGYLELYIKIIKDDIIINKDTIKEYFNKFPEDINTLTEWIGLVGYLEMYVNR